MRFISVDLIIDNTKLAGNELMVKFEKKKTINVYNHLSEHSTKQFLKIKPNFSNIYLRSINVSVFICTREI